MSEAKELILGSQAMFQYVKSIVGWPYVILQLRLSCRKKICARGHVESTEILTSNLLVMCLVYDLMYLSNINFAILPTL